MLPGRKIRLLVLLAVLAWVGVDTLADRLNTTDWDQPLWVGVYPINADGSERTVAWLERLRVEDFTAIDAWFQAESQRHGLDLPAPVSLRLGSPLAEFPPLPPADGGWLATTLWSLGLRGWADDHDRLPDGLKPDVRLFLLYYDPATHPALPHSLGLQKGLVGIVHVFAGREQAGSNRVVIAHELLHALGASDKYDAATAQPRYPDGFAEPDADPRYPQRFAEIMGGRTPLAPARSEIPHDIDAARIGAVTAREIRWQ